jgi:hypothetical protein
VVVEDLGGLDKALVARAFELWIWNKAARSSGASSESESESSLSELLITRSLAGGIICGVGSGAGDGVVVVEVAALEKADPDAAEDNAVFGVTVVGVPALNWKIRSGIGDVGVLESGEDGGATFAPAATGVAILGDGEALDLGFPGRWEDAVAPMIAVDGAVDVLVEVVWLGSGLKKLRIFPFGAMAMTTGPGTRIRSSFRRKSCAFFGSQIF